jgi:hypothetical protein
MPSSLKSELLRRLARTGLTEHELAFLERWLAEVRDPVWEELAAKWEDLYAKGRSELNLAQFVGGFYGWLIGAALRARRTAESARIGPTALRKQRIQQQKQERAKLAALAAKMDEVAAEYTSFALDAEPPGPLGEVSHLLDPHDALGWLKHYARKLRELSQLPIDPNLGLQISRQSGGRRKRRASRELGVFVRATVGYMHLMNDRPHYHAVASIANLAFPDADLVAEDVRSMCRPTQRARRLPTGALSK